MTGLLLLLSASANPHGDAEGCAACHSEASVGTAPEEVSFTHGSADETCLSCHAADPHPVGMKPETATVPGVFPLVNGELACLSCHDEPACHGDAASPGLLRGTYPNERGFCAACHVELTSVGFDPHQAMLDPAIPTRCLGCHDPVPADTGRAPATVQGDEICVACHQLSAHAGSALHRGPMEPEMAERAKAAGLPLTPQGELVCSTCHDPHPPGITQRSREIPDSSPFPESWLEQVLAPSLEQRSPSIGLHAAPVAGDSALSRLPLEDGALCQACHTPGGIEAALDPSD